MSSRTYFLLTLALCAAVLVPVAALNLVLGNRSLGSPEITRMASEWQQATRGVTYAPPFTNSRPFKILRLADRQQEINAIVLGDSMMMGVTNSLLPAGVRAYNFSLVANPTAVLAEEFEYVERHLGDHLQWVYLGLNWPIGMLYARGDPASIDLSLKAMPAANVPKAPFLDRLADALSRPKVISLGEALRHVISAPAPFHAFRETFLETSGADYHCPDGQLARDFDVVKRGICLGFRYDGSWTFAGERHLGSARATVLARAAAVPSSKFSQALQVTEGEPHAENLRHMGETAMRFVKRGGRVVFLLPPLVPGMEREMLRHPRTRERLMRTKKILDDWARNYGITVIDAGQSERFGCEPGEFLDENHAYPECHARVFSRYGHDSAAGRVMPGLYRPQEVQSPLPARSGSG